MSASSDLKTTVHHTQCDLAGTVPKLPVVGGGHHRVVVRRPVLLRPRQTPLPCARDAALSLPGPYAKRRHFIALLLTAVAHALEIQQRIVLVVGHAVSGERVALEQHRVRSVQLVVTNDRVGWVELATNAGSLDEIQGYLRHLTRNRGWTCAPEGLGSREIAADVHDFQQEFCDRHQAQIEVDGICGVQTLGAVFEVLRWEWETWLADRELTPSDIEAANVHYVAAGGLDRQLPLMKRVGDAGGLDVLVASTNVLPDPGAVRLAYASQVVREEPFDVHWHFVHDDLRVRLFREGSAQDVLPWGVLLEDDAGAFREVRELADGQHFPDGAVEVTFASVPCRRMYTLSLLAGPDAPREVMLANVPYDDLIDDRRSPEELP